MSRLPRWLERLLYGRAKLPIPHGPQPDEVHYWNCEECGRKVIPWESERCPKCWARRPPIVAPPDAPPIPEGGP